MYGEVLSLLGFFLILLINRLAECRCPFGTFGITRCQYQCHCKNSLDCNQQHGVCMAGCSSPWSGRNCQQENVSLNSTTDQSSGLETAQSWYGVDGNITTCAVTKVGNNGWWMVKLDKPYTISKMFVISATNTSLLRWKIMVGDDRNLFTMQRCTEITSHDSTAPIFCDKPLTGQYVAVLNTHGPVAVCELYVYVCSKYSFGSECELQCACKDHNEQCNTQTGACSSGCRPGRIGIDCQKECLRSYGPDCSYPCGHCKNGTTCDPMSGICPQKCDPGWTGITCDRECKPGFYGYDCNSRCGQCLGSDNCHHVNGSCRNGCKIGWSGDTCKQDCNKTHFGRNCSQKCGDCFDGTCDKLSGICTSGCKPGFQGDRCDTVCSEGKWGLRCDEHCGQCQNKTCHPVNGICHGSCNPGWTGPLCLEECAPGTFGQDCSKVCDNCKTDTCNVTTGICPDGCKDGFEGSFCIPPELSPGPQYSEKGTNTLEVFLGISVTIVVCIMVCLIFCLVSNWRREDISKYDRPLEKKETNTEEMIHLTCNGQA